MEQAELAETRMRELQLEAHAAGARAEEAQRAASEVARKLQGEVNAVSGRQPESTPVGHNYICQPESTPVRAARVQLSHAHMLACTFACMHGCTLIQEEQELQLEEAMKRELEAAERKLQAEYEARIDAERSQQRERRGEIEIREAAVQQKEDELAARESSMYQNTLQSKAHDLVPRATRGILACACGAQTRKHLSDGAVYWV